MQKIDFKSFETLYCDSIEAIYWAFDNGVSRDILVKTSSPSVVFNNSINSEYVDEVWSQEELSNFQSIIYNELVELKKKLDQLTNLNNEVKLLIILTYRLFNNIFLKLRSYKEEDLNKRNLIITTYPEKIDYDNFIYIPFKNIFKNSQTTIINYKIKNNNQFKKKFIPLLPRLFIGGFESIAYRFYLNLKKINFLRKKKKTILIARENELVIESAFEFIKNGYSVKPLKFLKHNSDEINLDDYKIKDIERIFLPFLTKKLNKYLDTFLHNTCIEFFFDVLKKELKDYQSYFNSWENILSKENKNNSVILTNVLYYKSMFSMYSVAKKLGFLTFTTQHGIAKEANILHNEGALTYEINSSDYFFSYNKKNKEISENSFFKQGSSLISGMPKRFLRLRKLSNLNKLNFISRSKKYLFISSKIYIGNTGRLIRTLNDLDLCKFELNILIHVLSKIESKVDFKEYPMSLRRYPDIDPVKKISFPNSNINFLNHSIDMRFILHKYDLLISYGSSNTATFAILSNIPFVFINFNQYAPLHKDFRDHLKQSIFYFDFHSSKFYQDINSFLKLDIKEIRKLWKSKKNYRENFIHNYLTQNNNGGEIIFNAVKPFLN